MPSPNLHKTIFEVRYQPRLKFYNLFMSAAEQFTQYPHWETNRLAVVLRDYETHCSLYLGHDKCVYEQDSADEKMDERNIKDAIDKLRPALDVGELLRFGYRRLYLVPLTMSFDSLVTVLNVKLFSQDEKLKKIMPAQVRDLMYRTDLEDESFKYHLLLGPLKKAEVPKHLNYNKKNHLAPEKVEEDFRDICLGYPEVSLLIDIDIYKEAFGKDKKISLEEASGFVKSSRERAGVLASNLCEYLFEKKIGK